MQRPTDDVSRKERSSRIQLIARVQVAYEDLREAMQRYQENSPRARAALAAARRRLSLLNRALAMMALEAAQAPA
jgi:heme oxygenase